jgi:thymidylate synthase (FAD)
MKNIEVKILNPEVIVDGERMMVAMARLTQRGHSIKNMADFMDLLNKPYNEHTVHKMSDLPHPTIQKFAAINIAIVGASRRFLAQITRHQNEVKFMSGSLQYSDYSDDAQFCIPYEVIEATHNGTIMPHGPLAASFTPTEFYIAGCRRDLEEYTQLADVVGRDAAGYKMPQGMRNVLMISALPFQWKHMIEQRSCNRNTLETQYVMLRCWEELVQHSAIFDNCGPACISTPGMYGICPEGTFTCKSFPGACTPSEFLDKRFPLLRG